MKQSSAPRRRCCRNMPQASDFARARNRPHLSGFRSPRPGGALYHPDVSTRVLLVEPNSLLRDGIRSALSRNGGIEVVAEASTAAEALAAAVEHQPDVVLLDFDLADAPATDTCDSLTSRLPAIQVIVLAEPGDASAVAAVLDRGARAYLLKDAPDLDLAAAVERVHAGESVIDPRAAAELLDVRRGTDAPKLSRQELKVLRLVAEGLTNPEIGTRLYLSRHTVKEYLSHAMRKLEASNRIEAVRKATEQGLIAGVAQDRPEAVAYNRTGEPARSADLKVTPLKLDQLRSIRKDA
jgi:DNA-binding NarL/FixJ family response regulator